MGKKTGTTAKSDATQVDEVMRSRRRSILEFYNNNVNSTVAVPKLKMTGGTKTFDFAMTREALDDVLATLKDVSYCRTPTKLSKDATDDERKAYNVQLDIANRTKKAVRMFATLGCPTTSLPTIPKGKNGKDATPSVAIPDVEAFLDDLDD